MKALKKAKILMTGIVGIGAACAVPMVVSTSCGGMDLSDHDVFWGETSFTMNLNGGIGSYEIDGSFDNGKYTTVSSIPEVNPYLLPHVKFEVSTESFNSCKISITAENGTSVVSSVPVTVPFKMRALDGKITNTQVVLKVTITAN